MSFDKKLFGDKLKRCREQLQLNIGEVSIKTGFDQNHLSSLEAGLTEPTGDEVLILSDFFKHDYNFFISNEQKSASEQVDILYRKFGDEMSKSDRWKVQEFIFLCECEEYILNALDFSKVNFSVTPTGAYYKNHGNDAALKLRKTLGYGEEYVIQDPYFEFRRLGFHIFRRRLSNSNISGLFINHPYAGQCILVNYHEDIFRQNFTLAHEAAHAIFDFSENVNISFDDEDKGNLKEVRANTFAANFLMPKEFLKKNRNVVWTRETIVRVCLKLKINPPVLAISLKEAGVISEDEYHQAKEVKIPTADKRDPELADLPPRLQAGRKKLMELGLSTFYVRKCHEAYNKGFISASRMAEMFLISEIDLPGVLQLFNLQLQHEN